MKFLEKIRRYIRISEVAPISRRYFIMNAFDGATTILGIVIGAYVVGITNELWVIWSGLGAALAMGLSGFAGAYMIKEAERAIYRVNKPRTGLFHLPIDLGSVSYAPAPFSSSSLLVEDCYRRLLQKY